MPFSNHTFTYSTRLPPLPFLGAMAKLCCDTERRLHAHLMRGGKLDQALKDGVMAETGLPGRYYNGITKTLEGKIDAVRELRKLGIANSEERVRRIAKKVKQLEDDHAKVRAGAPEPPDQKTRKRLHGLSLAIHGKKRKADAVGHRIAWLKADLARPVPSLCFGAKKQFRKQFHLKENGYADHKAWLKDWRSGRTDQFMVPGSHDEVGGNKTSTASVEADGSITVRLLIPERMRTDGEKHAVIRGLRFGYGHDEVVRAIGSAEVTRPGVLAYQAETRRLADAMRAANEGLDGAELELREAALRKERNRAAKKERCGHTTALTWRFVHDATGWRAYVTLNRRLETADWDFAHGAIGLDLNVGFISFMPVDGSGNPLKGLARNFPIETAALSSDRAKAVLGAAVAAIVDLAVEHRWPIIIENLDFQKKMAALRELVGRNLARRLSSFAYSLFKAMVHSRAARFGVRVVEVNPAYTSHMGRSKYAGPLGISVHSAAAAMIARRGMGLSEGMFASAGVPLGDGRHVTLPPPERMGRGHAWRSWGKHFGRYKAKRKALDAADHKVRSARARPPDTGPALARCDKGGSQPASASRPGRPGPKPPLLLGGGPHLARGWA